MDYQSLLQITEDNPEMMMEYLAANWLPLTMLMLYGLALIVPVSYTHLVFRGRGNHIVRVF